MASSTNRTVRRAGITVRYAVQVSRSAKKLRIRVTPAGVVVIAPRAFDPAKADAFVRDNLQWVTFQQAAVGRLQVRRRIPAGRQVLYRGEPHRVVVQSRAGIRFARVTHQPYALRVVVPVADHRDPMTCVRRWLRDQARREILEVLARRSQQMHRKYRRVYLRSQRTKWGNCSPLRNLSFNWRLIMAPPEVLDYIVVHELAHLAEQRHTRRFWLMVQSYCPEHHKCERWLVDHHADLYAAAV